MSLTTRPWAPGESLLCDACGNTRASGLFNKDDGTVVCQVCVSQIKHGHGAANITTPSDSTTPHRHTAKALKTLRDF